jgi:hypothetical protein
MSQNSEQYRKREEVERLIQEVAKDMPIWEGPFRYNPNLGLSYETQLRLYENARFIEGFKRKIGKKA